MRRPASADVMSGLQNVAEVVHPPDNPSMVVDDLLTDEVALTQVAVVIHPVPGPELEVVRTKAI